MRTELRTRIDLGVSTK